MKLTKIQISALADKIYNKIRNDIDEYNTLLDKTRSFDEWKKDNVNIVDALHKAVTYCKLYAERVNITYSYNDFLQVAEIDVNKELERVFQQWLPYKKIPCSNYEIEQDIILETIEDIDINTLVDKLVEKYSK